MVFREWNKEIRLINDPVGLLDSSKPFADADISSASIIKYTNLHEKYKVRWRLRIYWAFLNFIQLFLAYTIMLIVMTFNFLLFLAPIFGMLLGYFIIQWIEGYVERLNRSKSKLSR